MEIASWIDECTDSVPDNVQRVYLGHETCVDKMPTLQDMRVCTRHLRKETPLTLVTPLLTEDQFGRICQLIETMSNFMEIQEVVCNDWGLVQWLVESRRAEPVIGRLLVGQALDPRLAACDMPERQRSYERSILHSDGTRVALRYREPADSFIKHICSCAIAVPEVLSLLQGVGIRRLEICNALQGLEMVLDPGWQVTLHIPEVPVAVARQCWHEEGSEWLHETFPVPLFHRDNIVFYRNGKQPPNMHKLGIDRIVWKNVHAGNVGIPP